MNSNRKKEVWALEVAKLVEEHIKKNDRKKINR